jgi:glycosyltransferase involved in cell wall biosynthesis
MKVLFAFENVLPSAEADAEVFVATARYLAPLLDQSWMHVPVLHPTDLAASGLLRGHKVLRAHTPLRPAALRHFCCGISLVCKQAFRDADMVYTRNLWIAFMALLFGQKVVFDHYRPWPEQIPPLQWLIYHLQCRTGFLLNICHSDYTRQVYARLGISGDRLQCIRNGFEPRRLQAPLSSSAAKATIGVPHDRLTVVYTGRLNHKKGLDLAIAAARQLPEFLFILVGSRGSGPIEQAAASVANIRVVPWQSAETLGHYLFAADILLIPPSREPLTKFGSTVLPLKLFLYMASGRPIVAGNTPDVREVLRHEENAFLCAPDSIEALVAALREVTQNPPFASRLAAEALSGSRELTWEARAHRIKAAIQSRLHADAPPQRGWSSARYRAWLGESWRWLVYLAKHWSWVMPPAAIIATEGTEKA